MSISIARATRSFAGAAALVLLCASAAATELAVAPAAGISATPAVVAPAQPAAAEAAGAHRRAEFGAERASREAKHIADWVVDSADNKGRHFVIVDKVDARIYAFDAGGRLQGAAAALLGSARGDHTVPGIGDKEYADMRPEDRTTPAGRFVAELGVNAKGKDIVWVDYESALSIHRVINTKPKERRPARLASPTPLDNRISFGCINVPKAFYERHIGPAFKANEGIVYVLPEIRSVREVFNSYDVDERTRVAAQPLEAAAVTPVAVR